MHYILKALFVLLFAASCGRQTEGKSNKPVTMRLCLKQDPCTLDPRKNADTSSSSLIFMLYEGLTRVGSNGNPELALADSVEISENGMVYTFTLKESCWSDGVPITAHDFEYSWKKTLTPSFGAACPYLLFSIKGAELAFQNKLPIDSVGIQALDAKTLKIELENPSPYFLSLISFCNFYPVPRHIDLSNPDWGLNLHDTLVSSGPYNLVKWDRNKEIVLRKSPTYWDKQNIHLDGMKVYIIPNENIAISLFENKEIDFISTATMPLSHESLNDFKQKGQLQVSPVGALCFCTFNLNRFPFNNIHIRKALSCAIDRKSIAGYIGPLFEKPATQIIPPILNHHIERELIAPFNPEKAQEYLEIGLQELQTDIQQVSQSLILSFESTGLMRQIAQSIQEQWKTVLKLEAHLMECDKKTLLSKHMNRDYAVGIDQFYAQYQDPYNILERFKSVGNKKNLPGFESSLFSNLLERATQINNVEKRQLLLDQAEEVLASEIAIAPIMYLNIGNLTNPQFANIEFSPIGNLLFKKVVSVK